MVLDNFTDFVEKNLSRIQSLNLSHSPERLFHFIAKEINLTEEQVNRLTDRIYIEWYENLFQMKFLQQLIDSSNDRNFSELIIQNRDDVNFFGLYGHIQSAKIKISQRMINLSIEILTSLYKKSFSYKDPFASFQIRLNDSSYRISINHYSTSNYLSHSIYLRRQSESVFKIKEFCQSDNHKELMLQILQLKKNVIIAGSTGSGKTSLIRSLLQEVPSSEHLVIIEDNKEIELQKKNITHLIAREKEDGDITNFCTNLLRMRPDRVILGEIRSKEIVPLLLNLNSGHKGLLSSIHANSAIDTIDRLSTLFGLYSQSMNIQYQQIVQLISSNIDFIVYMAKGKISELIKINGCQNGHFSFDHLISN